MTDTKLSSKDHEWKRQAKYPAYHRRNSKTCCLYSKRYYLCLNEKLKITTYPKNIEENKNLKLMSKCTHQNKYLLSKYDAEDWGQ